ncbi:MAG: hypothetical protein ACUVXB_14610 [Bryobacteraceae bacterium]
MISRYNRIAGLDWIAIPLIRYLYAVERAEDVPPSARAAEVALLRDHYRRQHLRELIPDGPGGEMPRGDWIQLVGSAYDRTVYGFVLETRRSDDERLVEYLNAKPNQRRFHLLWRDCADFAREIVNFYYPGAVRRSVLGDFGIMTPKHAAKRLVRLMAREPELSIGAFVAPQIQGGRASTKLRGVNESLIRSKKYVAPLILFQPWVAASAAFAYLVAGRFNPDKQEPAVCEPGWLDLCTVRQRRSALAGSEADQGRFLEAEALTPGSGDPSRTEAAVGPGAESSLDAAAPDDPSSSELP